MELESCTAILTIIVALLSKGSVSAASASDDSSLQSTLIDRMDDIRSQMSDVTGSMKALDADISKALINCMGIHSSLCEALNAEVNRAEGLTSRWASDDPELDKYKSMFKELGRKRAMVNHLLGVFKGANNVLKNERKRTCNLNLGFHCQTEEISNFADMYDYLSSSKSPGKKRSVRISP
ncbi:unnamed protein product [Candidula unifasciata]|uniref:Uncharacterized protein n=1 Tax=Candidula unifasciata TaxID=100452 RepID=A0A8S3ZPT9_9EUPU|nr:unnamed protein product [Candidula unifasciata]